ncbi:L,D-transpeptidase [Streptomyces sp. NPDC086787]|uniref:L,D-transpeptidase n=1 Tax=Streptomyces sp. NPDC086787 TaxID=3365759 RepID=UPI00382AA9EF
MYANRSAGRTAGRLGAAVAVGVTLLSAVGCSTDAGTGARDATAPDARASAAVPAKAAAKASTSPAPSMPEPAVLAKAHVHITEGQTVGVGMPISVTFDKPVPESERKAVESRLRVRTSSGTTGAWSWVKDQNLYDGQRVDFRPESTYWQPNTTITLHVGSHRVRHFDIGRSLVATVDAKRHRMTVDTGGRTQTIPVTTGGPKTPTWNGTMVVMDKAPVVHMDSRTVGLGTQYEGDYNWAVHVTASGTYVHENSHADTAAGHENVTHGCVGLATDGTAKNFYKQVIVGDVIKVTGAKKAVVDPGNGFGDWNLTWAKWLENSRAGKTTTA